MKQYIKKSAWKVIEVTKLGRRIKQGFMMYPNYRNNEGKETKKHFVFNNLSNLDIITKKKKKSLQMSSIIEKASFMPVENRSGFFYSVDYYKTVELENHILDNYSIDYQYVIDDSLYCIKQFIKSEKNEFFNEEARLIGALEGYIGRLKKNNIAAKYTEAINAMDSLFERSAITFFEGLQRILFVNQFLWQTKHKHNGLGRLDYILNELYQKDIKSGKLSRDDAKEMLRDFFYILHKNCGYKSTMLVGDTGQIIILGGVKPDGKYFCNDLTYLFIEVAEELKLPEPKILLRCSEKMPEKLLRSALECILTGIGAPLLSNDDVVIPRLIEFGYDIEDSYNYVTAACWEPLVPSESCDQNNIDSINWAIPLVKMLDDLNKEENLTFEQLVEKYIVQMKAYIQKKLEKLSVLDFETDPLLSLFCKTAINKRQDIVRGGAKYYNLGLTSVGMGTVINSLLNLRKLVYQEKRYSLIEINIFRKENFEGREELVEELRELSPCYGQDDAEIIKFTNYILREASSVMEQHKTKYGGKFKFGLSSPNYLTEAGLVNATFDGRREGAPFSVHISSQNSTALTELLSFASQLDYNKCRINGNVVDAFIQPSLLKENIDKYVLLLKGAIRGGIYQIQLNVCDSATLIAAKKNPERYSTLVVRVWGFSAYFKDLPVEYQDLLIQRALESEKAA